MKEEGIYTMLPRALTCEDKYNAHKNALKEETPTIKDTQLDVELKIEEGDSWVFYWASEPLDLKDLSPIKDAKEAYNGYGNENNRGLVKTDEKGNATLVLNCPDVYRDEGNLYPRHVHYSVLDSDNNWSETIGTLEVICKFPYEVMKHIVESKNKVIINALPPEEFEKRHIPNSVNLYYKELEGKDKRFRYRKVKSLIKSTLKKPVMYPPIKEFLDDKEHRTTDVPIIVYCLNKGCPSAEKLVDLIYDSGFMNVIMYPGGTEEWFEKEKTEGKSSSKEVLFDDAGEEDEEIKDKEDEKEEEEEEEEEEEDEVEEDEKEEEEEEIKVEKGKKKKGKKKKKDKIKEEEVDEEDEKEILIYDGLKYFHYFEEDIVMNESEDKDVGTWDGEDIVWKDDKTYRDHLKKMRKIKKGEKGKKKKKDKKEDEEEVEDVGEEAKKDDEEEVEDVGEEAKKEDEEEDDKEDEEEDDKEDDDDSASEIGLGDDISFSSESEDEDSGEDSEDEEDDEDSNVRALKLLIKRVNKKVGGSREGNKYDGGGNSINYKNNSYCGGWGFRFVK